MRLAMGLFCGRGADENSWHSWSWRWLRLREQRGSGYGEDFSMKPILAPLEHCTGCTACYAACPRGAIAMRPDREGFLQPVVESSKCVGCGKCEQACPVIREVADVKPLKCFAARTKDDKLLSMSSSGGMFTELAQLILRDGGCVFGCVLDVANDFTARHDIAEHPADLVLMRGSKYVQSNLGDSFYEVRRQLESNRKVLFTGTPCQSAGLKAYLRKDYNDLYTLALICHGVPSPKVLRCLVREEEKRAGSSLKAISFRNKDISWRRPLLVFAFDNGQETRQDAYSSLFMKAFFKGLCSRSCCYKCHFRGCKSGSDIIAGDFWGIQDIFARYDDGNGNSAVIINSIKGMGLFSRLNVDCCDCTIENIAARNKNLFEDSESNSRREEFLASLDGCKPFSSLAVRFTDDVLPVKIGKFIVRKAKNIRINL